MKVTIKDIAKKAGVSVSTVSLVLNDRPCRVAQQTRDTIKDIAKQYNYKVNQTARSLVTRKSNILASSSRISKTCSSPHYANGWRNTSGSWDTHS